MMLEGSYVSINNGEHQDKKGRVIQVNFDNRNNEVVSVQLNESGE
jgi:hypothetical protein